MSGFAGMIESMEFMVAHDDLRFHPLHADVGGQP